MIDGITDREVLFVGDLLAQHAVAVEKFSVYASECSDPELKSVCRELAATNMRHLDRLMQQVTVLSSGASSMGMGNQMNSATRFTQANNYPATSQYGAPNTFGGANYGASFGANYGATYGGNYGGTNEGYVSGDTGSAYGRRA